MRFFNKLFFIFFTFVDRNAFSANVPEKNVSDGLVEAAQNTAGVVKDFTGGHNYRRGFSFKIFD